MAGGVGDCDNEVGAPSTKVTPSQILRSDLCQMRTHDTKALSLNENRGIAITLIILAHFPFANDLGCHEVKRGKGLRGDNLKERERK